MLNKFFFTLLFATCFSCQSGADSAAASAASDICTCFKPLQDINVKIQTLIKDGQGSKAETLLPEISKLQSKGKQCATDLIKRYGADTPIDTDKVSENMKKTCPKIIDTMGPSLFEK